MPESNDAWSNAKSTGDNASKSIKLTPWAADAATRPGDGVKGTFEPDDPVETVVVVAATVTGAFASILARRRLRALTRAISKRRIIGFALART